MYYLACCDNSGKCIGFLRKDRTVEKNPDENMDKLMAFNKKEDTHEICMQINLSHMCLPNGYPFRITPYKF